MSFVDPASPPRLKRAREVLNAMSISTRTFLVIAVLLSCFATLATNAYVGMSGTAERLTAVRNDTLPKQAIALAISNDIIATHMKVLRLVTLANAGAAGNSLSMLVAEINEDIAGETLRLRSLLDRHGLEMLQAGEIDVLSTKWSDYVERVRAVVAMAGTDAPKAVMTLGRIDDDFQSISSHLATISWMASKQTTDVVSELLDGVNASKYRLAFGDMTVMLISLLIAVLFAKSIIKPIQAVTRAMRQVSCGAVDVDLGYRDRKDEIGQMVEAIDAFRRTTQRHVDTIAAQNRLIDVAMNNMSHGLCMFDANERLIIRNDRYLEIFGMAPGSIEPGFTLAEMLSTLAAAGVVAGDIDAYLAEVRSGLARGEPLRTTRKLADGRTISICSRPLTGGGWVATHEDVTDRIEVETRIAHMALHDALTDLPNRASLREELGRALARVHRGEMVALHYVDLDHFKNVNDTLGHLTGDELLKTVAGRLQHCVRETDSVARLGGDEFAIIQVDVEQPNDAAVLAQRVQEALRVPFSLDGNQSVIDVSIGIAIAPTDGTEVEELLKSADMAVYAAKADGRGAYRFFELEMDQRVKERRGIESGLRSALVNGEFKLHYQPIVNVQTNRISSFEALIRWFHPERGLISPADFIPISEECGMIMPIGEWVLRQACHDAASWPDDIKVAINLSPAQFNKNLVNTVVSALASAGLPAHRLELEITESVLMQNTFATLATLNQLHDLGVKFSMDDFGTGYSSLSYLRSFPFDKIKIDRSFVSDMSQRENSVAIIRAVALLARSLDMVTTVEGVETQEQLDQIRALGCTEMQGYLYSPPRGIEDLSHLLTRSQEAVANDKADAA